MILYTGGTGSRDGIFFAAALTGTAEGGSIRTVGGSLVIANANEATLLLSVGTSFYHGESYEDAAKLDASYAADCSYEELLYRHLSDYQEKFRRVRFTLPDNSEGGSALPTDERLKRLHGDEGDHKECKLQIHDSKLAVLYFNYGRYLMLSASRPGTQPMNLQGIWNQDMWPAWGCRYTININTQMNYWPAEVCNLSECHLPLFDSSSGCARPVTKRRRRCTAAVVLSATTTPTSGATPLRRICGCRRPSGPWGQHGSACTFSSTTSLRRIWRSSTSTMRRCGRLLCFRGLPH